ncbi:unnamed protein product [Mytilus edulis]|uniref:Uncharacterized protein n=1 Tax=Mytilus edulis TaxID=6550 RepID=A0A8S3UWL2_MYTED|nr:unnamed protein product [Mytilus edulis]
MISDELSHTAAAVLAFLRSLLPKLHELVPNMSCVHYISDSPTSQYRNRYIFNVVAEHVSLFNVPASWQYFEAGHGKGPCDGVGAVAKRMADNAVKRDKHVIQDAKSFFAWASQSESSINYMWVGKDSIAQADIDIKATELKPIKGTMLLHAVFGHNESTIITREKSCFCEECFVDGKLCPNSVCGVGNNMKSSLCLHQWQLNKMSKQNQQMYNTTMVTGLQQYTKKTGILGKSLILTLMKEITTYPS